MSGSLGQGRVKKLPPMGPGEPTFRGVLKARPRDTQLILAGIWWRNHPRILFSVRLALLLLALGLGLYYAYQYGLVHLGVLYQIYTAIAAAIVAAVAVLSYLGRKAKFVAFIPPDDPGHYNIPYVPPQYKPAPGFHLVYIPPEEIPGTYPSGSVDLYGRRWTLQWYEPSNRGENLRALQFKFASVLIEARRNDAEDCHVEARIFLRHGHNGSVRQGTWVGVGQLNWYLGGWNDRIVEGELNQAGYMVNSIPNQILDSPTIRLNEYLSNPEVTINQDKGIFLPLFYMRDGWPFVYLCGPNRGILAGSSPDDEPVSFDLEVNVSSLKSRPLTFRLACTAKWDNLTVDGAE